MVGEDHPLFDKLQKIREKWIDCEKPLSQESVRGVHVAQVWKVEDEFYEVQWDASDRAVDIQQVWPHEVTATVYLPKEKA